MIHFTCDMCGKHIHPQNDDRFRVLIDMEQMRPGEDDSDLEGEYLDDYDDFAMDDNYPEDEEDAYHSFKFDLCRECARMYLEDPLMRKLPRRLRFMDN